MITKKEVQHIAKLARLGLTKREILKMQKELSSILDYMEKLKEVDVSKIEPTSHSVQLENVIRSDEVEIPKLKTRKKLIEQAPKTKNNYLKVKSIF
jgi:aspartyl-tRNA(Asn)/glutamyl-tRNA(Gln) amidotransferase subunit C